MVLGSNGQYVGVLSQDVVYMVLVYKDKTSGKIMGVSGFGGVPQCDWNVNGTMYMNSLISSLIYYPPNNCVGTYTKPAGTVLDFQHDYSAIQATCPN